MKKIVKGAGFILIVAVALIIMWRHTKVKVDQQALEVGQVKDVTFPDRVEKTINSHFSYDAIVVTGEKFNSTACHQATATLQKIQKKKWKELFLDKNKNWKEEDNTTADREENDIPLKIYEDQDGTTLNLSDIDALYWKHPDMKYISQIFGTDQYYPYKDIFKQETELNFIDKASALEKIKTDLKKLGINSDLISVRATYSLDINALNTVEQKCIADGSMEQKDAKLLWDEQDEGYYVFISQVSQDLPMFITNDLNTYATDKAANDSIEVFDTPRGYKYLRLQNWFDIQVQDQAYQLVPIEKIMETLDQKYQNVTDKNNITVKTFKLYEYPQFVDKGKYNVIPIWICSVAIDGEDSEGNAFETEISVPINAVTGKEMIEMEE